VHERQSDLIHRLVPTRYVYFGEVQNWRYQNSETLEPIVTKFGMGDYVGDMTQQAKIQTDRPNSGVQAKLGKWVVVSFFPFL